MQKHSLCFIRAVYGVMKYSTSKMCSERVLHEPIGDLYCYILLLTDHLCLSKQCFLACSYLYIPTFHPVTPNIFMEQPYKPLTCFFYSWSKQKPPLYPPPHLT